MKSLARRGWYPCRYESAHSAEESPLGPRCSCSNRRALMESRPIRIAHISAPETLGVLQTSAVWAGVLTVWTHPAALRFSTGVSK